MVGVWKDDARGRAEPFDAIELALAMWADVRPAYGIDKKPASRLTRITRRIRNPVTQRMPRPQTSKSHVDMTFVTIVGYAVHIDMKLRNQRRLRALPRRQLRNQPLVTGITSMGTSQSTLVRRVASGAPELTAATGGRACMMRVELGPAVRGFLGGATPERGARVIISGMSGNEIFCLSLKGYTPGEIAVGNSVRSLGLGGSLGSSFQTLAGGEIANITQLISEGRHAAISRMEEEARRHGAVGITGVTSELKTLGGFTEFFSQGTAVHAAQGQDSPQPFSTSASGIEMYCHVDAGYQPMKFVMGNVAYSLGVGRGMMGGLRTMAKGEVREYSQMYNGIRHLALRRMKEEAAAIGANAVVDVSIDIRPFGPGVVELLMTGTAAHHPRLAQGRLAPEQVATSELTGEELWNFAKLGYAPVDLVMSTSVYSLGIAAGIGTLFSSLSKGELTELTALVYKARENCIELMRQEATRVGAERVIGARLHIREISQGLIEVIAVGTAARPAPEMTPQSPALIPQAVIYERDALSMGQAMPGVMGSVELGQAVRRRANPVGCIIGIVVAMIMLLSTIMGIMAGKGHH